MSIWCISQKQDGAKRYWHPFTVEDDVNVATAHLENKVATSRKSSRKESDPMIFHPSCHLIKTTDNFAHTKKAKEYSSGISGSLFTGVEWIKWFRADCSKYGNEWEAMTINYGEIWWTSHCSPDLGPSQLHKSGWTSLCCSSLPTL